MISNDFLKKYLGMMIASENFGILKQKIGLGGGGGSSGGDGGDFMPKAFVTVF